MGMIVNPFLIGGTIVPERYANSSSQNLTSSLANVAGLTFSISANETVYFMGAISVDGGDATGLDSLSVNGPASPSSVAASFTASESNAGAAGGTITAYESAVAVGKSDPGHSAFSGKIVNGSNAGTVAIRAKSTSGGSVLENGAWMMVWRE